MSKSAEEFKHVKIPRDRTGRAQVLQQTYSDGYYAGFVEGKRVMKAEMTPMLKVEESRRQDETNRRNALQALSNVGEALAKIGIALADVTEPRRV